MEKLIDQMEQICTLRKSSPTILILKLDQGIMVAYTKLLLRKLECVVLRKIPQTHGLKQKEKVKG